MDPLDVVGEPIVEVSELIFFLDARLASRAGTACGKAGCAATADRPAGAAAWPSRGGGGRSHDGGGLDTRVAGVHNNRPQQFNRLKDTYTKVWAVVCDSQPN